MIKSQTLEICIESLETGIKGIAFGFIDTDGNISFIAPYIKDTDIPDIDTQKLRNLSNLKLS